MFCRYCGKNILDNAVFCIACGKPVKLSRQRGTDSKQEPVSASDRITRNCEWCGESVSEQALKSSM